MDRVTRVCIAGCVATLAILAGCNREGRAAEQSVGTVEATPVSQSASLPPSPPVSLPASQAVLRAAAVTDGGVARSVGSSAQIGGGHESDAQSDAQSGSSKGGTAALVAHPDHIQVGLVAQRSLAVLVNPREHDPRALDEGKQLFVAYNCADCHGGEGSGGMGPSLQDGRWHFGGTAGDVYESISEGRPDGMPSWGGRISDAQIWALVTYVRTLSSGKNVTTESFEGAGTVARGGH